MGHFCTLSLNPAFTLALPLLIEVEDWIIQVKIVVKPVPETHLCIQKSKPQ